MDNRDKASSWLSLLRKKINNKFKRNRQIIEDEVLEDLEPAEENQELEVASNSNPLSAQNCEEMRIELLKLNWYWPNLSRLDAQKLLSQKPNGSFL
jgi:hypothetical protein